MGEKVVAVEDLDPAWIDYVVGSQICNRKPNTRWSNAGGCLEILFDSRDGTRRLFSPSSVWADAGPLIERYRISLVHEDTQWTATVSGGESYADFWPLRAAMMALIASEVKDGCYIPTYK